MTTSTTSNVFCGDLNSVTDFISDMEAQYEQGNANNLEELLDIAIEKYDLDTEVKKSLAVDYIEMNIHFDTFEEDFGYTIKEYIKRGEGYFSAKNLGDLTYEDLLAACREYIDGLEEELDEEYGEDHHEDILDEDLDFDNVVTIAKTKAIYQKHTAANGSIDMQSVCRDIDADPILELR